MLKTWNPPSINLFFNLTNRHLARINNQSEWPLSLVPHYSTTIKLNIMRFLCLSIHFRWFFKIWMHNFCDPSNFAYVEKRFFSSWSCSKLFFDKLCYKNAKLLGYVIDQEISGWENWLFKSNLSTFASKIARIAIFKWLWTSSKHDFHILFGWCWLY